MKLADPENLPLDINIATLVAYIGGSLFLLSSKRLGRGANRFEIITVSVCLVAMLAALGYIMYRARNIKTSSPGTAKEGRD